MLSGGTTLSAETCRGLPLSPTYICMMTSPSYATLSPSLSYCTSCIPPLLFPHHYWSLGTTLCWPSFPGLPTSTSNRGMQPAHKQPFQSTRVALGSRVPPILHHRPSWHLLMESPTLCISSYPPSCQLPCTATGTWSCLHGRMPCLWTHPFLWPQILGPADSPSTI